VAYSLGELPDKSHDTSAEPSEGLTRREFCWESIHPALLNTSSRGSNQDGMNLGTKATASNGLNGGLNDGLTAHDSPAEDLPVESSMNIPEVTQFAIRYFDGMTWTMEWDSGISHSLPVAVEVALCLRPNEEAEPPLHHATGEPASEESQLKQPKHPVYRLLILLSSTKLPANGGGIGGSSPRGPEPPSRADSHGELR